MYPLAITVANTYPGNSPLKGEVGRRGEVVEAMTMPSSWGRYSDICWYVVMTCVWREDVGQMGWNLISLTNPPHSVSWIFTSKFHISSNSPSLEGVMMRSQITEMMIVNFTDHFHDFNNFTRSIIKKNKRHQK